MPAGLQPRDSGIALRRKIRIRGRHDTCISTEIVLFLAPFPRYKGRRTKSIDSRLSPHTLGFSISCQLLHSAQGLPTGLFPFSCVSFPILASVSSILDVSGGVQGHPSTNFSGSKMF